MSSMQQVRPTRAIRRFVQPRSHRQLRRPGSPRGSGSRAKRPRAAGVVVWQREHGHPTRRRADRRAPVRVAAGLRGGRSRCTAESPRKCADPFADLASCRGGGDLGFGSPAARTTTAPASGLRRDRRPGRRRGSTTGLRVPPDPRHGRPAAGRGSRAGSVARRIRTGPGTGGSSSGSVARLSSDRDAEPDEAPGAGRAARGSPRMTAGDPLDPGGERPERARQPGPAELGAPEHEREEAA